MGEAATHPATFAPPPSPLTLTPLAPQIHQYEDEGDVLIFLTGEEEIEEACRKIRSECEGLGDRAGPVKVLPLYSSLPQPQQDRIFETAPVNPDPK